jgi:hypothetical protein
MNAKRIAEWLLIAIGTSSFAQVPLTRPKAPGVALPGPQRHGAPSAPETGTIMGYVFWNTTGVKYNASSQCQGFSATVKVSTSTGLQTLGNNTSQFTSMGNVGLYTVCAYSVRPVPVSQNLEVDITAPVSAFSPQVMVNKASLNMGSISIPGGSCNKFQPAAPTATVLKSNWWPCGVYAYNVNYELLPASRYLPGTGGAPLLSRSTANGMKPTPQQGLASNGGMLLSGGSSAQSQSAIGRRLPTHARAVKTVLSQSKQGRKITNPNSALRNSAIIAVLQKQRQSADAEAAAMLSSIRPQANPQTQPSQVMAATGSPRMGSPGTTQNVVPAGNGGSGSKMASLGMITPTQFQSIPIICAHDPTFRILNVSGQPSPATFTQDSKYNFYTITGCSFGNGGASAKVYVYYQGTFHLDFQIQEWNENGIKLSLDPNLKGVNDHDNLTLIVQRADGKQTSKGGFKFYAARDTLLLSQIPKPYFTLDHFRSDDAITKDWRPNYTSGSSASVTPNLPGLSAEVHWDLTDNDGNPPAGDDLYDFSKLQGNFSLDSALLEWRDLSCTDPDFNQFVTSSNNWSVDWNGNSGVRVTWQGQQCNNAPGSCGGAFQGDCFTGGVESNYGLNVWVTGPRGIDPWSGNPTLH